MQSELVYFMESWKDSSNSVLVYPSYLCPYNRATNTTLKPKHFKYSVVLLPTTTKIIKAPFPTSLNNVKFLE